MREFERLIGYDFSNKTLLELALTHRSCKVAHNERLEFLGDAVLDLIVGEQLYRLYPGLKEGWLSKMRANLVNEKGLVKLAKRIDLGSRIKMSASEAANNGRTKDSILADAFESLIGAIYLDSGATLEAARGFVLRLIDEEYSSIDLREIFIDYKTTLQEVTQARFGVIPVYKLLDAKGPDHKKVFTMAVFINDEVYGSKEGISKKLAEQNCAKEALEKLHFKREIDTRPSRPSRLDDIVKADLIYEEEASNKGSASSKDASSTRQRARPKRCAKSAKRPPIEARPLKNKTKRMREVGDELLWQAT